MNSSADKILTSVMQEVSLHLKKKKKKERKRKGKDKNEKCKTALKIPG